MRVDSAMLCDAVSIRDGLLHILGGGITRIWASEYPAGLNAHLAARIMLSASEATERHTLAVSVENSDDGSPIGSFSADFGVGRPTDLEDGEEIHVPLGFPLHAVQLPAPAAYRLALTLDGADQGAIGLVARMRASDGDNA